MTKVSPNFSNQPYLIAGPLGRCVGTINQFVMVGALSTDPYSVQWCAIGNPTNWPTPNTDAARAVQSGTQRFPTQYGYVTEIANGDFFGYVFQERAVTKVTYVGGDVVFTFDTFEEDRGCEQSGKMVQVDDLMFFESDRGFHALQNDQISDIGYGKVEGTYGAQ